MKEKRDVTQIRVLVVDDDSDVAELIAIHIRDMDWEVIIASDGKEAIEEIKKNDFDIVLLDLMLPEVDGMEVCRRIREEDPAIPIMAISAKNQELDVILAYKQGFDDYVSKPFRVGELMARVKGLLRRHSLLLTQKREQIDKSSDLKVFGDLVIDMTLREVRIKNEEISLTKTEFDLLSFLASYPGRPFSRAQLLEKVWGYQYSGYEHAVTSHINRLRAKLEPNPESPSIIVTVWGVGYCFSKY